MNVLRHISLFLMMILLMACLAMIVVAQGDDPASPLFSTPTPQPALLGPIVAGNGTGDTSIVFHDLGSNQRRELTFGHGYHQFDGFSPDGCRILFSMSDNNRQNYRLYTARLDGSGVQEIITFEDRAATSWDALDAAWSPSDGQIAFILARDYHSGGQNRRTAHLATILASGGTPTIHSVSGTEGQPAWSPEGSWLVYTSYELNGNGQPENDLWLIGADGKNKRQLTQFASGSASMPHWSPDGQVISFIYAPIGNNHQFWTTPASGGAVQQWSDAWTTILAYDWLPDGSGLLASIYGWQGHDDNLLWRVPLPGFADTDATRYLADPEAFAADYPRFSPDGRMVAFRSAYQAMVYDSNSGVLYPLPTTGQSNSPLYWSPAGFAGEQACTD